MATLTGGTTHTPVASPSSPRGVMVTPDLEAVVVETVVPVVAEDQETEEEAVALVLTSDKKK